MRSIVKAHLAAIHALPVIKKESSVELRKLLESTNEHVQALEALGLPVDQWDAILVYWLLEKLDNESRKQFELAHPGIDVLTFKELKYSWIDEAVHWNQAATRMKLPSPRRRLRRCFKKHIPQLLSTQQAVR